MKAIIAVILLVSILLSACSATETEKAVEFYYPRVNYTQNSIDSVIAAEMCSNEALSTIEQLLNRYLQGPQDPLLRNPFPDATTVITVYVMGNVTLLTVSDNFSQLEGLDLVMACSSLSRTVSGMTGTPIVQISCESVKLDGKNHITIGPDTILYIDTAPEESETPSTED